MIKRIVSSVVISSIISAALLFMGITIMGKYSPVLASPLNALVAETNSQNSPDAVPVGNSVPLAEDLLGGEEKLDVSSDQKSVSASPTSSIQPPKALAASTPKEIPVAGVTIAQLLNNPKQFVHQVFTITGIATSLGKDKFLLNDGTGQILVEVEDDLVGLAVITGLSITVTGELDDSAVNPVLFWKPTRSPIKTVPFSAMIVQMMTYPPVMMIALTTLMMTASMTTVVMTALMTTVVMMTATTTSMMTATMMMTTATTMTTAMMMRRRDDD